MHAAAVRRAFSSSLPCPIGAEAGQKRFCLERRLHFEVFFRSPRYSDDIDFDVQGLGVDVLRRKVNLILHSRPFLDILDIRNVALEYITEHKQTETTQRWKLGLVVPLIEQPLPTKIEFSRRGVAERFQLDLVSPEIIRDYDVPPVLVNHYPGDVILGQKLNALISRSAVQARDIFDIFILSASMKGSLHLSSVSDAALDKARERIFSMDFASFKSQVVSYLEPSVQAQYDSEEAWDRIRLQAVESLTEGSI